MTEVEVLRLISWLAVGTTVIGFGFNVRILRRAGPRPLALALFAKGCFIIGIALTLAIPTQWYLGADDPLRTPNVYYTYVARALLAAMPLSLILALSRLTRRRGDGGA